MTVRGFWHRLLRGTAGGGAVEFAIIAPMVILLGLGAVDTVRMVLLGNKVNRVAASTADMVARNHTLRDGITSTNGEIGTYFQAANIAALPLDLESAGRVYISAVTNADGTGPRIAWQRTHPAYELDVDSRVGNQGGPAVLPGDMTVRPGETALVSEVFYEFTPTVLRKPVFFSDAASMQFYRPAFFRPRFGGLAALD